MENAMVRANCRNRIPVVPGKSATGTNTATSTREVAITAPVTSLMAADEALRGVAFPLADVARDVLDHDDGVVHDEAGGERDAEQGQRVDGEAEELHEGEGADQGDGDRDGRDERAAPVLQEDEDHQHDQDASPRAA